MTRIQIRRDTAANWTAVNPGGPGGPEPLADGEIGYERDTGRLKVGNGTASWTALPYLDTTVTKADVIGTGVALSDLAAPSANVAMGAHRLIGVGDATAATDALNRETGDGRYDATGAAAAAQAASDPSGSAAAAQAAAIAASAQGLAPTAVKASAYTAAAADFVPVSLLSGSVTITLPTAPADKTRIGVKVVKVDAGFANTCTVAAGGSDVFNVASGSTSLTLSALFQGALLQYKASTGIWYVSTADTPLAQPHGAAQLDSTSRLPIAQAPLSVETGTPPAPTWQLVEWAQTQNFQLSSATRDTNGAITTASVVWPDGATGTFTTDTASTAFPGAIDAYHVTYVYNPGGGPVTKTITQTAVTRDPSTGAVTAQPALTVA